MFGRLAALHTARLLALLILGVALIAMGCETNRQPVNQPLTGLMITGGRIGPARLLPEEIQSSVDAYADRFVNAFAQVTDTVSRENPGARNALHAIKLATATGVYMIAAGPSPVVSVLDLIVQVTLLRHSMSRGYLARLPEDQADQILEVLTRYEEQAWAMGARILTEQQQEELRALINDWIAQNPNQTYVASVRFSDFSRLRPAEVRQAASVLSLLRLDPFASIDPATREIEESRLLAERIFFFAQRLPQLITWRAEQLHYTIMSSREVEGLLADVNDFTETTTQMANTISELRSLIPEQTAAAIDQFNRMITEQRQATFDEISRREEALLPLLDRVDTVLETVRTVNADIQGTLSQVNGVQESLRQASDAVRQAGVAWEDTVNAVERTANTLMADDGSSPPSEPVTFAEISRSIDQLQKTAVELRLLLNEFNTASDSGTLGQGIAASVNELEHAMTGVVNLITIRVILVIALLFVAMVLYRLLTTWLSRRSHTRQAA